MKKPLEESLKLIALNGGSEPLKLHPAASETVRRKKLLMRKGNRFIPLSLENLAVFFLSMRITYGIDFNGERYMADQTLADLQQQLDPALFFRVNRKTIVNIEAIKEFRQTGLGKLSVRLQLPYFDEEEILVSQSTAPQFRKWIQGIGY